MTGVIDSARSDQDEAETLLRQLAPFGDLDRLTERLVASDDPDWPAVLRLLDEPDGLAGSDGTDQGRGLI
jgi:hypothetical protein